MRSLPSCFLASLLSTALLGAACDSPAPDLREWKAGDHDRSDQPAGKSARPPRLSPAPSSSAAANPTLTLVEVTWRNQCASCHGPIGRGDGPQGPMVHAPNLTLAEWQAKMSDQEIAEVIRNGKNRMPKFDFPPDVIAGLVARIRASKGR
ncbi:MAG TPA: cytochrome c [Polyangiaceae bacterium]|nr:cytochrome c [Polyangiaceae bacterium]